MKKIMDSEAVNGRAASSRYAASAVPVAEPYEAPASAVPWLLIAGGVALLVIAVLFGGAVAAAFLLGSNSANPTDAKADPKNLVKPLSQQTLVSVPLKRGETTSFLAGNGIKLGEVKSFEAVKGLARKSYRILDDLRLKNEDEYFAKCQEVQKALEERFSKEKISFPFEGSCWNDLYVKGTWRTTPNEKGKEEVCLVVLFDHGPNKKADQVLYRDELSFPWWDRQEIAQGTVTGTVTGIGVGTHYGNDRPKDVPLPYILIKVIVTKVESTSKKIELKK